MRYKLILLTAALAIAGCTKPAGPGQASDAKRYPLKGTVVSVDKAAKTAVIDHERVEGYMDAMTMAFPIHEDWVWDDLTAGSQIQAELVVDNQAKDPYWLEKIAISAAPNSSQPPLPAADMLPQVGRMVPDIKLTDQDGKRFSLAGYRGKTLAVTFIYRECPLPDYCIKMSRIFSDLAIKLAGDESKRDRVRLLSISFDPERDTPEKLKAYGQGYLGNPAKPDFTVWQLAVGSDKEIRSVADFFGLRYEVDANDKTQINHSLVTAVIGPDGTVRKMLPGNRWTEAELEKAISDAMN